MSADFFDLRFVLLFGFSQMGGEFLDLRFVVRLRFSQMGSEFLHLRLVLRFRVRVSFSTCALCSFRVREVGSEFLDLAFVRFRVGKCALSFSISALCRASVCARSSPYRCSICAKRSGTKESSRLTAPGSKSLSVTSHLWPDFATDVFGSG